MNPKITHGDFQLMEQALKTRKQRYAKYLRNLLSHFRQVDDPEMDSDTVRLNSRVTLWVETLQKKVEFRIVLPEEKDIKTRKISVFTPVCLTVLGHREGEQVQSTRAGIKKVYRILKVENETGDDV